MVRLGNFLFRYRNALFPAFYLLLFLPAPKVFGDYRVALAIGVALAVLGQFIRAATIGLAYIVRGGKDRHVYARHLVQEGIFAHCRNPLYLGNFLVLCGLGFTANSVLFFVLGLPLFAVCYAAIIAAEENYLQGRFNNEYDDYCARVNRFLPRLKGFGATLHSMEFKWRRLLVKEYGSAYAWMAGMLLLMIENLWGKPGPLLWTIEGVLGVITLGYLTARYLKKRRIIIPD
ncbi:MAG TPA: isoprenylcysteine carboxylmethyltransferase family protein [Verrucomicrobiae bacterium]|nr:isoprenylcysteine carboxylmethyltransferase family protein [Verrucomicrobiae bacterium]